MYDDISVHITLSHQWEVFSRLYLTVVYVDTHINISLCPQVRDNRALDLRKDSSFLV